MDALELGQRFTVAVEDLGGLWPLLQKVSAGGRRRQPRQGGRWRWQSMPARAPCPAAAAPGGARPAAAGGVQQQVWAASHSGGAPSAVSLVVLRRAHTGHATGAGQPLPLTPATPTAATLPAAPPACAGRPTDRLPPRPRPAHTRGSAAPWCPPTPRRYLAASDPHLQKLRQFAHSSVTWFRNPYAQLVLVSCEDYEEYKRGMRLQLKAMVDAEATRTPSAPELLFAYCAPQGRDPNGRGPLKVCALGGTGRGGGYWEVLGGTGEGKGVLEKEVLEKCHNVCVVGVGGTGGGNGEVPQGGVQAAPCRGQAIHIAGPCPCPCSPLAQQRPCS